MGLGDTIGLVAVAGVLIALLCVASVNFPHWVAYKRRKMELEAEARSAKQSDRGDYVEMLEERVRVLERIATDRGLDVAHQIEALRSPQQEENIHVAR